MRLTKSPIPLGPYVLPGWCFSLRMDGPPKGSAVATVTFRIYPWAKVVLFAQVVWRWVTRQELWAMARIEPNDTMPCGCHAGLSGRVFRDDEEVQRVVAFDTEARTAEVHVQLPDGRYSVVDGQVETRLVTGNLRLECKTHGRVA